MVIGFTEAELELILEALEFLLREESWASAEQARPYDKLVDNITAVLGKQ